MKPTAMTAWGTGQPAPALGIPATSQTVARLAETSTILNQPHLTALLYATVSLDGSPFFLSAFFEFFL